ncbi:MAG: hypothetical protein IT328_02755 [Caldilineaceae bacterium]|nr:hypothetical protein [Caldilineaceae bacterium]
MPVAGPKPLTAISEQPVTVIELRGPLSRRKAQLSGLAWYGDYLILLPQYPDRFENQLFYLEKQQIISFLWGDTHEPLRPQPIPLIAGDLLAQIPGFQGFEAILFTGARVFLTIEAEADQQMVGYLVSGMITPNLSELRLDPKLMTPIAPQTNLLNLSDETILSDGEHIVTIYEGNGAIINGSPVAHLFNPQDLQPLGTIPFPHIDYRITDATALDNANRFWAINNFSLSNSALKLGPDPLATQYGIGPTHAASPFVERLVEFQYSTTGITLVDTPPLQLQLLDDAARNWEGIARLESPEFAGFLLVTDNRPETILAFVPQPH